MINRSSFVPTGDVMLAVVLGAAVPCMVSLGVSLGEPVLPKSVIFWFSVLSPFLAGFLGSILYGSDSANGPGYNILAALLASCAFPAVLLITMYILGRPVAEPAIWAIYMAALLWPVSIPSYIMFSIIVGLLGRLAAKALER